MQYTNRYDYTEYHFVFYKEDIHKQQNFLECLWPRKNVKDDLQLYRLTIKCRV